MTERWTYHHETLELAGEITRPEGPGNGRAVLVVHEADGIGGNVRRRCALLAGRGYVAAAADMHGGGRVLARPQEMHAAVAAFRADPALFRGRVRAALDALVEVTGFTPRRIAAIGYCFGGAAVLELARDGAGIAAVASFHGLLTTAAPARAGTIRAPLLVATGGRDPLVPPDDIAAFEAEMNAAGADWHVINHGRALHSFTNEAVDGLGDPRMGYDRVADAVSWAAAMAFLDAGFQD